MIATLLAALPPGVAPVAVVLVAVGMGMVAWRLFRLALRVVFFVVFVVVIAGVALWLDPGSVDRLRGAPSPSSSP